MHLAESFHGQKEDQLEVRYAAGGTAPLKSGCETLAGSELAGIFNHQRLPFLVSLSVVIL